MGTEPTREMTTFDGQAWLTFGLALLVFLGVWGSTLGTTLTYDEAVYVDLAGHPFESSYYPEDTFLRHPPLALGLLAAWEAADLPTRGWAIPWVLAGLAMLARALGAREAPGWLLAPAILSPGLLGLTSVTPYPPLFCFMAMAGYGWATERRWVEVTGWNLAVLTHELALLVLALRLLPRAAALARERVTDPRRWLAQIAPYPAAVVWGAVMILGILQGDDPRGGVLTGLLDPSANAQGVMGIKPWISLVFVATLAPMLRWPGSAIEDRGVGDWGLIVASWIAIVVAPFYRYLVVIVPLLIAARGIEPTRLSRGPSGCAYVVLGALVATGLAGGLMVTGTDSLNAGDIPGLVDHEEGATLVSAGEDVVVRSPPSFAHALQEGGWTVASTGPTGPTQLRLVRGAEDVTLHRAVTVERLQALEGLDAALVPVGWDGWISSLEDRGWSRAGTAGGLVRLEA